jgi:hypothetical protein
MRAEREIKPVGKNSIGALQGNANLPSQQDFVGADIAISHDETPQSKIYPLGETL